MKKLSMTIALALTLVACTDAETAERLDPILIDESFGTVGFGWDDGRNVPLKLKFLENNGNFVVCAAAGGIRTINDRRALAAMKIMQNGKTLVRGLSWISTVPNQGLPVGMVANCQQTTTPIVDNPDITFEMTQSRF